MSVINRFIRGIFGSKKSAYHLSFVKEEDNCWYIDMPWEGNHHNLMMVGGSDDFLDYFNEGTNRVNIEVIPSERTLDDMDDYILFSRDEWGMFTGAHYFGTNCPNFNERKHIWICPVTLTVFGSFPKFIYVKYESKD